MSITNKAQEFEVRTIMQGLEEFATFMSFQGNSSGIRIISVETTTHSHYISNKSQPKDVINLNQRSLNLPSEQQTLKKYMSIND